MAAQRFSNPQKASSYFVCRRVFEKGNEKGMCIRMCDVSPFYGCLCSISSGLNEKCYTLSFAIRPLPSRLGTWARWQLHHGEAEQGERAFPIWKRRSFHFGSDLGCCPSFFRYNFNSRKFTKNPWGDDIIIVVWKHQLCQHQLNPNSSNMAAHHLGGPRNLRIIQRFRGFSWKQPLHMGNGWVPPL